MRLLVISQLVVTVLMGLALGTLESWPDSFAGVYGASLGIMISLLTRRSTDRALMAAVMNPRHGLVAMFSGFTLRYAVAILGLLFGFKVLQVSAEPMIGGFILMILVQVLAGFFVRPKESILRDG